jgi:GNAT superfamily N-acetyltransferase
MPQVREALPPEVERVLGMYEWLFAPPGSVPPRWDPERAREAIAAAIVDPDAAVLVAERRGELLGLCTAYLELNSVRFGLRCWVEDLAVSPRHRSQGVAKRLLDAAKDWARERGRRTWSSTAATPGRTLTGSTSARPRAGPRGASRGSSEAVVAICYDISC